MFKKQKYFVFILFLLLPLFSLFADEVDYPDLPNVPAPTPEQGLPSYVNYIFNIALALGGLVAFGILIWGGVLYLTSAGNPEQVGSAKKKLTSALSGLLILFAIYLILTTINPDLAVTGISFFQDISILQPTVGICLCPSTSPCTRNCDGENNFFITDSRKVLDLPDKFKNEKWEVKFYTENPLIYIFDREGYQEGKWTSRKKLESGESIDFFPRSVYFAKPNGVCLYDHIVTDEKNLMHFPEHFVCLTDSAPNLGLVEPFLNDKAQAVIIYGDYGAILFDKESYNGNYAMVCAGENAINVGDLGKAGEEDCWGVKELVSNNPPIGNSTVSSVEVWRDNREKNISGSITFYNRPDCKGGEYKVPNGEVSVPGVVEINDDSDQIKVFSDGKKVFENIVSIKINGTFAVILEDQPDSTGDAQLFKKTAINNCIPSLVGSAVFESTPESPNPGYQTKKIRRIIVVPARE